MGSWAWFLYSRSSERSTSNRGWTGHGDTPLRTTRPMWDRKWSSSTNSSRIREWISIGCGTKNSPGNNAKRRKRRSNEEKKLKECKKSMPKNRTPYEDDDKKTEKYKQII